MSGLIPAGVWAKYKNIIRKAHDTFNQDTVLWERNPGVIERFNEEEQGSGNYITLKALIGYNVFRTWPLTQQEVTGEADNQNMVMILNREYLGELGYLTPAGYFNFRPDKDYFIHRGIKYKGEGDTLAAQAQDDPLLIYVVLHREEILSGDSLFNISATQPVIEEPEAEILNIVSHDVSTY